MTQDILLEAWFGVAHHSCLLADAEDVSEFEDRAAQVVDMEVGDIEFEVEIQCEVEDAW